MQANSRTTTGALAALALLLLVQVMPAQAGAGVGLPAIPPVPPVPPIPYSAPAAPQDVQAARQPDYVLYDGGATTVPAGVIVAWTPVAGPSPLGVDQVLAYNIYRGFSSGSEILVHSLLLACYDPYPCSYYDDDCPSELRCHYQVSAVNAFGEGPRSAEAVAPAKPLAPLLPTSKAVRHGDGTKQGEVVLDDSSGGSVGTGFSVPYDHQTDTYASDGAMSATLWMYGRSESCVPGSGTQVLHIHFNHFYYDEPRSPVSFDPCLHFGPVDGWASINLPIKGFVGYYGDPSIWGVDVYLVDGSGTGNTVHATDGDGQPLWLVEFSPLPGTCRTASECTTLTCAVNDDHACATALTGSIDRVGYSINTYTQSTAGYTTEPVEPLGCGSMGATAWFTYRPTTSRSMQVIASGYPTALAVHAGSWNGSTVGCDYTQPTGVTFYASAGTTYYFQVGGYQGASGTLRLSVS